MLALFLLLDVSSIIILYVLLAVALTQVLPIEIVTVRLQFIRKYRARIIYLYFSLRAKYLEKGLTEEISLNGPTFINGGVFLIPLHL